MSHYVINIQASQDLNNIADYFFERDVDAGERFFQAFNRKCQQLAKFPSMGRSYTEIRTSLRGVPLQGYIVFYKVRNNGVEILRVISGRRNLGDLFVDVDEQ